MICDECETVAHCLKNGCVPKQPTKDEALKLALEALDRYVKEDEVAEGMPGNEPWVETKRMGEKAITAIKQALLTATPLAAPVQELVCICGAVWQGQELVETPAAQPAPVKPIKPSLWEQSRGITEKGQP